MSGVLQMYGFAVVDVTGGRENDEFLGAKLGEVVGRLEKEYEVEVRAIIADAAATCQKGRQLVVESRPDILALDCAVHQIASLTQHFFKVGPTDESTLHPSLLPAPSHPLSARPRDSCRASSGRCWATPWSSSPGSFHTLTRTRN